VSSSFEFPDVERLTVGTVGPPGKRIFYLQVRQGAQLVSLKMEKQQVGALAQALAALLSDLPPLGALPEDDELELEQPVVAEWPVGSLRIDYDQELDEVVVIAEEVLEADDEGEPAVTGGMVRLAASREQVAALARRSAALVAAGRPPCPLCGYPLDPEGHTCPKSNGHKAPTL
jgi:uncharacterized repeat protein (TIGR03847 family)